MRTQGREGLHNTKVRYERASSALRAISALKRANLHSLIEQTHPQPTTIGENADLKGEFATVVTASQQAFANFEVNLKELTKARQQAAQRRKLFWQVAGGAAAAVLIIGFFSWQARQERLQVQATATAVAIQMATATSVAEATATSVALYTDPIQKLVGMEFVLVPAGEFTMGSPDGMGEADEHPQTTLDLAAFLIGKTEVTNAQYRPFIEAGGYAKRTFWTETGWTWRQQGNVTEPSCWQDANWNQPDFPVVCVSWYEAVAYTRWLAAETKLEVRLPSEAEWEKAARGTDGRTYPWGETAPNSELLNFNGNIRKTSTVGSYPLGVGPYGALDMAGNVTEWNSTLYKEYPYNGEDGREDGDAAGSRLVRGGSWADSSRLVDGASRSGFGGAYPDTRIEVIGFRVVFSSPGS